MDWVSCVALDAQGGRGIRICGRERIGGWGLAAHNMLAAAAIAHVVIDFIDTSSCPGDDDDDDDDSHIVSVVLAGVSTRMPAVRLVRVWVRESIYVCVCVLTAAPACV